MVDGAPVVLYLHARARRNRVAAARVPVAKVAAARNHRRLQRFAMTRLDHVAATHNIEGHYGNAVMGVVKALQSAFKEQPPFMTALQLPAPGTMCLIHLPGKLCIKTNTSAYIRYTIRAPHRLQQAALDGAWQRRLAVGPAMRAAAGAPA